MDLGTFRIESLIVHDVPRHRVGHEEEAEDVLLSDAPSELDAALRNFFTERITRSLSEKNAYEVERDPESKSPIPDEVLSVITASKETLDAALAESSQVMAHHLFACQTGNNPAGLLIVCTGEVDGRRAVSILKLEREDAIRVERVGEPGHRSFNVQHLRDLMLGKNTRVFKASIFAIPEGAGDDLDGRVSDTQTEAHVDVARFFLSTFLGCRLKVAPDNATKAFFDNTQDFINTVEDGERKARYEIALIAAMNLPQRTMTPDIVLNQLEVEDRQSYQEYLVEHGVLMGRFEKDTRLVAPQIRRMIIDFERSKLRLSGTTKEIEEFVNFPEGDGPIEIHDQVKNVRGGTR